jgi:hypothetical protein
MRYLLAYVLTCAFACFAWAGDKPVVSTDTVRTATVRAGAAIVCRNLAMVAFMKQRVEGSTPPDFTGTGCKILLEGTRLTIESGSGGDIVIGETMFGDKVRGVTDPTMIDIDP